MYRERPVMRTRMQSYTMRRRRRWDAVSWWFSLLFVIPVVIIAGNFLIDAIFGGDSASTMVLKVTDAATGRALAGVEVVSGDQVARSDEDGEVRLRLPAEPMPVTVKHPDYQEVFGQIDERVSARQTLALRSTTVHGTLKDEESGQPISGASVIAFTEAGQQGEPTQTGEDGSFTLRGVPSGARVRIEAGDYGVIEQDVGDGAQIDVAMRLSVVTGAVSGEDGEPVAGAMISSGEASAETEADGSFRLTGIGDGANLMIAADGFVEQEVAVPENRQISINLEPDPEDDTASVNADRGGMETPEDIRAIYVSANTAATPSEMERLIALADETEVNAVVLDIKEDYIFYDTEVEFFREADVVNPLYDAEELLGVLHDHDIYVIARLVVFKDPLVAEHRPDLAIKEEGTNQPWRDYNGAAWVNPIYEELWDANIALAVEAAELGFDEIQYDYIRFPSDGDLNTADFAFDYGNEEARVEVIVDFLKESHAALEPTGAKFAVDVFGIIAVYPDDQGIGQRLVDIAPYVDYVCPMIYPSHFDASSINVGGEPNDRPYETIELSLALAEQKMPGMEGKLRPWLQDFSLSGMSAYGADEVRAQIEATEASGASGWMIWDPGNQYSEGAFASS